MQERVLGITGIQSEKQDIHFAYDKEIDLLVC